MKARLWSLYGPDGAYLGMTAAKSATDAIAKWWRLHGEPVGSAELHMEG